jgi:hypothetical protein
MRGGYNIAPTYGQRFPETGANIHAGEFGGVLNLAMIEDKPSSDAGVEMALIRGENLDPGLDGEEISLMPNTLPGGMNRLGEIVEALASKQTKEIVEAPAPERAKLFAAKTRPSRFDPDVILGDVDEEPGDTISDSPDGQEGLFGDAGRSLEGLLPRGESPGDTSAGLPDLGSKLGGEPEISEESPPVPLDLVPRRETDDEDSVREEPKARVQNLNPPSAESPLAEYMPFTVDRAPNAGRIDDMAVLFARAAGSKPLPAKYAALTATDRPVTASGGEAGREPGTDSMEEMAILSGGAAGPEPLPAEYAALTATDRPVTASGGEADGEPGTDSMDDMTVLSGGVTGPKPLPAEYAALTATDRPVTASGGEADREPEADRAEEMAALFGRAAESGRNSEEKNSGRGEQLSQPRTRRDKGDASSADSKASHRSELSAGSDARDSSRPAGAAGSFQSALAAAFGGESAALPSSAAAERPDAPLPGQVRVLNPENAFGDGLTNVLEFMREDGMSQARIVVEPPALGRVDVSLQATASGVEASFRVDNEHLRQMLQQQLDTLKASLQAQGIHVSSLAVDIKNRDDQRGRGDLYGTGRKNRRVGGIGGTDDGEGQDVQNRLVRLDLERGLLHWVA